MTARIVCRAASSMPSDQELVADIAGGDLQALGALFERYEPAVRRYLGRLGLATNDVDDLIQATFLEVVRAARGFDARFEARPWLFGIATMMTRRQRRTAFRATSLITKWAGVVNKRVPSAPNPSDEFECDELARRLQHALDHMAPKKREVFTLITLEGLSGEETARALGIPVKTVWTRLHHARRELREALGGEQ